MFALLCRTGKIDPRTDFLGPIPFLVPWFGAVGAVLLSLKGVFDHRGLDWDPNYCYWHWARPIVGAVVGTVSVLVFQSGILAVGGQTPNEATTSTPKNLLYYLIAFVVGYREDVFRELIKRLADVVLTTAPPDAAPPVIESLKPAQATTGVKTDVKVVGRGLAAVSAVKLGDVGLAFVGESDTRLTVSIPAEAEVGTMSLVVTTSIGSTTATFTVAAA